RWAVPFAIWTLVLGVCTLGPVLHVDGVITGIRLPWDLPAHLPILKNILPSRLMVFVALGVAIWVALWVSWGGD
ncbi:membrane protein, partial [mine drainage metagenome]